MAFEDISPSFDYIEEKCSHKQHFGINGADG
jgi:hypothetical protein